MTGFAYLTMYKSNSDFLDILFGVASLTRGSIWKDDYRIEKFLGYGTFGT